MSNFAQPSNRHSATHFKTPMKFDPSSSAKPSPSRDEIWKQELGFDESSEGDDSNTEDEPEADQINSNKASSIEVHALQTELKQKEKQREELLIKLKALSEKTTNYKSKLQKAEQSKKSQIKIMKKTQESQIQMKAELIHNLEELIEEQETKILELESRIKGGNIGSPQISGKASSIKKLVDSINDLHTEKSRIYETWLSTQSELETVRQEHKEAMEKMKWELSDMDNMNRKIQVENLKLQQAGNVITENNNQSKHLQLQEENDLLKTKIRNLEQDISTLEESAKESKKKHDIELMEVRKKLRDTETKYTNLASTPPKVRMVSVVSEETKRQLDEMIKQNKDLESLLGTTRSDLSSKNAALQSEIKALRISNNDATVREKKALSECQSLRDSLKESRNLEGSLREKDGVIKSLESEIYKLKGEMERLHKQAERDKQKREYETKRKLEEERQSSEKSSRLMKAKLDNTVLQVKLLSTVIKQIKRQYKDLKIETLKMATAIKPAIKDVQRQILNRIENIDGRNKDLVQKYKKEMALRKKYHNELVDLKGNIRVYCRVRPVIREDGGGKMAEKVVSFDEDDDGLLNVWSKGSNRPFEMDQVFKPDSTQEEVFNEVKPLVISCIDGYNVCIFAYGQTGSGKTFTMEGIPDNPGINQRALQLLFEETSDRQGEWQYSISISVMEIYNEMLRDLLSEDTSAKLDIKQGKDGLFVPGLQEVMVSNLQELNEVFQLGKQNRSTAFTDMNEHSSRSHALLCVTIIGVNRSTGSRTTGKLNLVDLAGSERISKSGSEGARMKEAQNINKSLSSLGDVIHSLKSKSSHVPYRNSKLTYLLQESLGGDSKTLMVVQVAPVEKNVGETVCSLTFAQRVRTVELGQATRKTETAAAVQLKDRLREYEGSPSRMKTSSLPRPRIR
ncbi:kinesin-like protein KIFC3 isoform X2 [Actinia tenebrosa]|uniref:Kinesin-like protein n=1 Tax=Actinia tenebrosa TaxID=6105 RepID=A0A6P8I6S1_ACTTE|nr:kinesin-like protein KIFC3 isoform X2 [Actinia tenebrosa]